MPCPARTQNYSFYALASELSNKVQLDISFGRGGMGPGRSRAALESGILGQISVREFDQPRYAHRQRFSRAPRAVRATAMLGGRLSRIFGTTGSQTLPLQNPSFIAIRQPTVARQLVYSLQVQRTHPCKVKCISSRSDSASGFGAGPGVLDINSAPTA